MHTVRVQNLFMSVFCVCAVVFFVPSMARAEQIDSFVSDIEVRKDAIITVKETISYKFDDQRHGIFRCIPTKHQDKASSLLKDRYIDIEITNVRMDTHIVPYEVTHERKEMCIKIGDPNNTITGAHTYELSYTVGGAISYEVYGGADLYWNVTGNEWEVPILSVSARVSSPDQIFMTARSCYRGIVGEANSCQMSTDENGVVHFSGTMFSPAEGLTLSQSLNRSVIPTDIRERYKPLLVWGIIIFFGLFGIGYGVYAYKTKYKTGKTIIPQYEPYPGVKPMYTGVLFDGKLDPRDITAGIVYLAQQGFIKIRKIDKKILFFFEVDDYEISLTSFEKVREGTNDFQWSILTLFFDIPQESELLPMVKNCVTLSELKSNYSKQRLNSKILLKLRADLQNDLENAGFMQTSNRFGVYVFILVLFSSSIIFLVDLFWKGEDVGIFIGVFYFFMIILVLLSRKRRTRKGYEALDHLKGFKQFLEVTEKQRYIFHNAPQKSPEQFMEYLPYAIAFGVEKEWAKTFEGIAIPNPNWYDGGNSTTAFSAISLSQSLGGFSSSLAASSGSSPSSGGGSSGGGSGGGGGGSW